MHKNSDGKAKKGQKHKNKTAFKIVYDTKSIEHQKKVSLENLCQRCADQIQWKLTYNKYNKMTEPARCNICNEKHVFRTYMRACQKCAVDKDICAKCLKADYERPENVKLPEKVERQKALQEYQNQIEFMKTLRQRSRRTVRRHLQKGLIEWSQEDDYFIDTESGQKMAGLHFKKGISGLSDEEGESDVFGDDLGDEDDLGQEDELGDDFYDEGDDF